MWRFLYSLELTVLLTSAAAFGAVLPTPLPDAPSAVLAERFQGSAEDAAKPQPLPPGSASAADPATQDARPSVFRRAILDQKEIYTAPLRRRNVKWDILFLAATGGMIAGDKHISGTLSRDRSTYMRAVDISQHISDIGLYSMTASVAGLWLSSPEDGGCSRKRNRDIGWRGLREYSRARWADAVHRGARTSHRRHWERPVLAEQYAWKFLSFGTFQFYLDDGQRGGTRVSEALGEMVGLWHSDYSLGDEGHGSQALSG